MKRHISYKIGDNDCMDWSDENMRGSITPQCFWEVSRIDCDEHLCMNRLWSCGDGQCIYWHNRLIFQNLLPLEIGCLNMRNMNYMCELTPLGSGWTLSNGLCWFFEERYNDSQLSMNNLALSRYEKCIYLIRCLLSDGFELDCPCNRLTCSNISQNVCDIGRCYPYPEGPLIRPYAETCYKWTNNFEDKMPHWILLSGNVRCRGYSGHFNSSRKVSMNLPSGLITNSHWYPVLCLLDTIVRNYNSSMKYDDDCWKNCLTFNGRPYAVYDICTIYPTCISQYRINDGWGDCRRNADENVAISNNDLCSRVRKHRFQCSAEQLTCFTTDLVGNGYSECSNKYDEYVYGYGHALDKVKCQKSNLDDCQILKEYIKNSSLIWNSSVNSYLNTHQLQYQSVRQISFRSYCDSFWNLPKHVDELLQNCQNWICHQHQYQCQTGQCIPLDWVCDGQWDCADASDEEPMLAIHQWSPHNEQLTGLNKTRERCLQNYLNLSFSEFCDTTKEFPCLRSNVSDPLNVEKNRPCIPYSKIGDEIEDCYNAYDEKNTFESQDGTMWGFSIRCGNYSAKYLHACQDAALECAAIFCPYQHYQLSNCQKPTDAFCIKDNRCVPGGRCNRRPDCSYGEDEYWCAPNYYLEQHIHRVTKQTSDNHPIFYQQTYPSFKFATETFPILPHPLLLNSIRITRNSNMKYSFLCNKGVTVINVDNVTCFCPPSYFGDKCQFFSDRITIVTHLRLTTWTSLSTTNSIESLTMPTLFKIKVNFLFNGTIIDHYEFYSNPIVEMHKYIKHKFYLLYSRSTHMLLHKQTRFYNRTDIENNHPYSVHFDLYALYNNQNTPITLGSWYYPIYFDFLPSFRLATILRFPSWFTNSSLDPCVNHTCNQNSTCQPIFNQNNSYFCSCKSGFHGKDCSKYEDICTSYCSPHSLCRPDDHSMISATKKPFCICPLGYFGPRCYLKFQQCNSNPCLNNGSCIYNYVSYGGDSFVCHCSKFFYGDRCQRTKMIIQVRLNTSIINKSLHASTVQYYDVEQKTLKFLLRHQEVTKGFQSYIYYAHGLEIAPALCILKAYYDLNEPKYFIIYIQPNRSLINISSTPENCPKASTLLEKSKCNFIQITYSIVWLYLDNFSKIPNIFKYHQICRNDNERLCFYDNVYLCICQSDHYRVDCFLHNTEIDHCTKCFSNGKCVQGDIHDDNNFICLCPKCSQGDLCEFNLQAFGFTLDSLLIDYSKQVKIIYLSMIFLLFIIGLFNNLCSFATFKRPTPRKVGVGNYLLLVTCFNQMSLLCLLIKVIQITFGIINIESCQTVSYLFPVFTRLTYWLTSWITIHRLLFILFPTSVTLKNPRLAIVTSITTALCLFVMHIHEIIYCTTIRHRSTNSLICVTNFDTHLISIYNRVSTLIHYLLPFFIQIIAITVLIVLAARSRNKATGGKEAFRQVLTKQFRTQKELYITPIIIILSSLPQTIFTFSLACTQLTIWHRHLLLIAYILSYGPQILGFILYVLPSSTYKKEFSKTLLSRMFTR